MKIIIDTNVFISGIFFGGYPRKVLDALIDKRVFAAASPEIINEYKEIIDRMLNKKQGRLDTVIFDLLLSDFELIIPTSNVHLCRDSDDDKFINCAIDAKAPYIVSGDSDLLVLEKAENVRIITAKDFCDRYL